MAHSLHGETPHGYLERHKLKAWLERRMEEVLVARPDDPFLYMREAIEREALLREQQEGSLSSEADASESVASLSLSKASTSIAQIKARIIVQGRGGAGEQEIDFSRVANEDMMKGAKGAKLLRKWVNDLGSRVSDMLFNSGEDDINNNSSSEGLQGSKAQHPGHGAEGGAEEEEEGEEGGWRLEDRLEERLPGMHQSWFRKGAERGERGVGQDAVAELLIELGIVEGALSGLEGLDFEEFRRKLVREWEVSVKQQMLAKTGIVRSIAEVLEGGSPDNPLNLLADMTSEDLASWCADKVAPQLQRVLGAEQTFIREKRMRVRQRNSSNNTESANLNSSSNSEGVDPQQFKSFKFSMEPEQQGDAGLEKTQGRFGNIEEFYSGLVDKIGLPQVRLLHAMESEHTRRPDSRTPFNVTNYGGYTTPEREWQSVTDPEMARQASKGDRVIRPLEDLLNETVVKEANLQKVEIYALQLYTGPMYCKYNAMLRGFPEHIAAGLQGNRYATTITCIVSGIIKLSKLMVLPEDRLVYRGLGGLELPQEFKYRDSKGIRGGVEYALMSTSLDKQVALRYADISPELTPTLLEIRIGAVSRGASIRFLSQYPMESEILCPPMSYLEVDGKTRIEMHEDGRMVRVIPLEVNANVFSSTIDQILGRRKSLHISTVEHTVHEIRNSLAEMLESVTTEERLSTCPYTARGLHHVALAGSIVEEAEQTLKHHKEKRSAEWYNDERNYDSAVREAMDLMPAALRKFEFWIENPRSHAEVLCKKSLRWITRRKMSDLNRMLEDEIDAQNNPANMQASFRVRRRSSTGSHIPPKFTRKFSGRTAIKVAAEEQMGAKEMALELCRMRGAVVKKVDELDVAGDPPLLVAASMGDIVSLRLLVAAGSDVDARSTRDGSTALHTAAFMGFSDCVKFLVEAGANVAAQTNLDETVFYVAAQNGHITVLQYLLGVKGQDAARSVAMVRTSYGWSCAYVAAWNGHETALRMLFNLGGNEMLDATTSMGWTAAHGAALNGYSGALEALEQLGGMKALLAKTQNGSLCSMMACEKGHAEVLETLVSLSGADWPQFLALNNEGWGCAHEAASAGHWEALKVLIDHGGRDLVLQAKDGVSILVAAVVPKDVCQILMSGYISSLSNAVHLAKEQLKEETRRMSVENIYSTTFIPDIPDDELIESGVLRHGRGGLGLLWGNEACRKVCMELVDGIAGRELLAVQIGDGGTILHGLVEMGGEGVAIAEDLALWGGAEGGRLLEQAMKDVSL